MLILIAAYAPQSGLGYEKRQAFHYELQDLIRATTTHSTTMASGDFNAQLLRQGQGEEDMIGAHVFKNLLGAPHHNEAINVSASAQLSNRQLLLETCVAYDLAIANTFFDRPDSMKV
eukprot:3561809-Pyramimonas_sp.AAC.1